MLNGLEMLSENEATRYTKKQEAIDQLGKVLPIIITAVTESPEDDGKNFFRKIDIKYGFWRIICQTGAEWNFAYVLPGEEN